MDQSNFESKLSEIIDILKKQNERINKLESRFSEKSSIKADTENETPTVSVSSNGIPVYTPSPSYQSKKSESTISNSSNRTSSDIESEIGGKWLVKIGIFALLIGIIFFLRYAFTHWIGPVGQIMTGYILGLIFVGGGEYIIDKYSEKWRNYALAISGGGIGIFYITTFAASNYYSILDPIMALAAVFIVSIAAAFISVRNNSKELLAISMIGGFLSPLLLGISSVYSSQTAAILYILFLNSGVFYISLKKAWKNINLLSMLFTYFNLFAWRIFLTENLELGYVLTVYVVFFVFYLMTTLYQPLIQKRNSSSADLGVLALNAVLAYIIASIEVGYSIFFEKDQALLALGFAIVYTMLAYVSHRLNKVNRNLTVFLTALSILFVGISIPLILENRLITLAWAVLSLVVLWIGFEIKDKYIRALSYVIGVLAIFRMASVDLSSGIGRDLMPFINPNFLELFAIVMAIYVGAYMFYQYRLTISEKEFINIKGVYIAAAQVITLLATTYEIDYAIDYYFPPVDLGPAYRYVNLPNMREFYEGLAISLWWLTYSFMALSIGTIKKSSVLKGFSVALFYLLMFKVIVLDIINNHSLNISQNFVLSIIWTAAALVGIMFGFYFVSKNYRVASLLFLGLMILKLFLFDTWKLGEVYRIVAYLVLGVILIVTGYIYVKYQDKIKSALL